MARHRRPQRYKGQIALGVATLAITTGVTTALHMGITSATVTSSPEAGVPLESYNALNEAQQYVARRATSEKMLKDHLQRAGYGRTATNYATSNVRVDYGAEAKELAGIYMQATALTEQGMRKQLRSDGFNAAHVDAAVAAAYDKKGA